MGSVPNLSWHINNFRLSSCSQRYSLDDSGHINGSLKVNEGHALGLFDESV